jgi:Mg2+/Co2+ transporter CorB
MIQFIVRLILKLTPSKRDDAANILAAHEEIRGTIELKTIGGAVAKDDAAMLGGVLDLRSLQVLDIMVHRTKMQTIDIDDGPQKVVDEVLKSQHTRIPLWKDEPDNIVGVLHTKDLLVALSRVGWDVGKLDMTSLAAQPWFVPDTTSVTDQLNEFLKRKAQLALVVDEYGEVQGLITLEDILEEIVGDIEDEFDLPDESVERVSDGVIRIDGTFPIDDFNEQFGTELEQEDYHTVAGFVFGSLGRAAEPGDEVSSDGLRFTVLETEGSRIQRLEVEFLPAQTGPDDTSEAA